jgi:hypothetical protein
MTVRRNGSKRKSLPRHEPASLGHWETAFLSPGPSFTYTERMTERTRYQQNIIRNYYENRDAIALQRAQELITELYLSEGKKREKYWDSMAGHLQKLGVKDDVIAHLRKQDDPQLVAKIIQKLAG